MKLTAREFDSFAISMFKLMYKINRDIPNSDCRFAETIAQTSDEKLRDMIETRPELYRKWHEKFYSARVRGVKRIEL